MSDPIGDIERLVKLRDAGALTPEEFETQKARVLGGPTNDCPGCGAPVQVDVSGRCIFCGFFQPAQPGMQPPPVMSADPVAEDAVRAHPDNKIQAIKAVREATGNGLNTAKARVDAAWIRVYGAPPR